MSDTPQWPAFRWIVLIAAAVILALSMGLLINGLTAFFVPLEKAFGWQRGDIALINTFGLIGLAVGGIAMGRIADRFGTLRVGLFGGIVLGLCVLASAHADRLWQFYALYLVAGALGGAAFFAPLVALVGNWFKTGAGLALGIVSAGQAVGQGGIPLAATVLIAEFGWSGALTGLGIAILALVVPLALLMRQPPHTGTAGAAADDRPPLGNLPHTVVVATISIAVIGCCTLMAVPLMHLFPLMQGQGIGAADAGSVMLVMLSLSVVGRIFFGKLADMIGALPAYITASVWQTVMVFGFTQFESIGSFYLYAMLYGFGYAGVMTGILTTTRVLTRPSRRASAMGVIGASAFIGHGIGGWQAGMLFDLTGGYTAPYAVAAAAGVFNLLVVMTLVLRLRRPQSAQPA
ncbi:MAG: MFS transporter [Bauldia litoralis]